MDAIDYYTEDEAKWKTRCEEEKATAYQTPLGVAFVSFQSETMAIRFVSSSDMPRYNGYQWAY